MAYKALRRMKIKRSNGEIVTVHRGDELPPDAEMGRNIKLWIQRGWLTDADGNDCDDRHWGLSFNRPLQAKSPVSEPEPLTLPPPSAAVRDPESFKSTEDDLSKMSKSRLVALADEMGEDSTGTRDKLIRRIEAAQVD